MIQEKQKYREYYLEKRQSLTEDFCFESSKKIQEKLISFIKRYQIKQVSSYFPIKKEVRLDEFHEYLFYKIKIPLSLPSVRSYKSKVMEFWEILFFQDIHEFQPCKKILSFNKEKYKKLELPSIQCVLIPGILFNSGGYRLGYGGGFYDRFFSFEKKANPSLIKLGIAYDFQRAEFKKNNWDLKVDILLTEKSIYKF